VTQRIDVQGVKLRNCKRCGKVFPSTGSLICRECLEKEEEQFQQIKIYLAENPGASIDQIHRDTQIPVEVISDFVRKGLLVGTPAKETTELRCMICKRPISSGKICLECQKALSEGNFNRVNKKGDIPITEKGAGKSLRKKDSRLSEKMYTMDLIRKKKS